MYTEEEIEGPIFEIAFWLDSDNPVYFFLSVNLKVRKPYNYKKANLNIPVHLLAWWQLTEDHQPHELSLSLRPFCYQLIRFKN